MNNSQSQKDWFAINMDLPTVSAQELEANNITSQNTTLKDKAFYKDSQVVKDMFSDPQTKKFNEEAYDNYYDSILFSYNKLASGEFFDKSQELYEYHPLNDRPAGGKVMTDLYTEQRIQNPYGYKKGVIGLNVASAPDRSYREIAQENEVYDSKTGKSLGWKPNDDAASGLLDFWKKERVAIAVYKEDTMEYDPEQGREVLHRKGDHKFRDGKIHYETLGDDEPYNREVLSWADTLTTDGTWANKYDFMDSDGLTKSFAGVLTKAAIKYAPLFIPEYGAIYAYGLIGQDLMSVMPMLAKSGIALFAGDSQVDADYWKNMNKLQQWGASLGTSGVSDYGKANLISVEGVADLVGSVFSQLKGQQAIAKIPQYLGMTAKSSGAVMAVAEKYGTTVAEKMMKGSLSMAEVTKIKETIPHVADFINRTVKSGSLAKALATSYMSLTSAAGITEEAKRLNMDERDTAAMFLGVTAGFFGMMRSLPIGEWTLKGIGLDDMGKGLRAAYKKDMADPMIKITDTLVGKTKGTASRYRSFFDKGKAMGSKVAHSMVETDGYLGAMMAEGTEEFTEEIMQDGARTIYNGLSGLGMVSSDDHQKFVYGSGTDILTRYGTSFIGGALGGALFHFDAENSLKKLNPSGEDAKTIDYFVRNNMSDRLYKMIDADEKDGKFGSKVLSIDRQDINVRGLEKQVVFKPAATYKDSQNAIVANMLRNHIKNTENQLFQYGIMSDIELSKKVDDNLDIMVNLKLGSSLFEDYQDIASEILRLNREIGEVTTLTTGQDVMAATTKVNDLNTQLRAQQEKLLEITSGEKFKDYQKFALFAMNSGRNEYGQAVSINEPFSKLSKAYYAKFTTGNSLNKLGTAERLKLEEDYNAFMKLEGKDRLKKAYNIFTHLNETFSPHFFEAKTYIEGIKEQYKILTEYELPLPTSENINALESRKESLSDPDFFNEDITFGNVNRTVAEHGSIKAAAIQGVLEILGDPNQKAFDSDVVKVLDNVLDSLTTSDVVGTASADILWDMESDPEEPMMHQMPTIDGLHSTNFDSAVESLHDELSRAKFSEVEGIFAKYEASIKSTPAVAATEIQHDLQVLAKVKESFYNLPIFETAEMDAQTRMAAPDTVISLEHETRGINALRSLQGLSGNTASGLLQVITTSRQQAKSKQTDAINNLLRKFEIAVNNKPTDIITMLTSEFETIAKQLQILDYAINNPEIIDNLEYAIDLINKLKGIIIAHTDYDLSNGDVYGYNNTMNNTFTDIKLETISQSVSLQLLNSLGKIGDRAEFILELSKLNSEDKLKNGKENGIVMESLFYSNLITGTPFRTCLDSVKIEGEAFMTPEIADAIENATILKDYLDNKRDPASPFFMPSTEEELFDFEVQVIDIQKALYERTQYFITQKNPGISIDAQETSVFNQMFGVGLDGKMSQEMQAIFPALQLTCPAATNYSTLTTNIQPLDQLIWFNTSIRTNPVEFINNLRGIDNGTGKLTGVESSKYAPFYGQEYNAKVAYAAITNSHWFNLLVNTIASPDGYLPSLIKPFYNAIFTNGGPGVGKSSAIAAMVARVAVANGLEFWIAAPEQSQVEGFKKNVGSAPTGAFDKANLLKAIFNNPDLVAEIQDDANLEEISDTHLKPSSIGQDPATLVEGEDKVTHHFMMLKQSVLDKVRAAGIANVKEFPQIIFIDEATQFSNAELAALNVFFQGMTNPPILYFMGDLKQSGFLIREEKQNMNLFHFVRTPTLLASLRDNNDVKKHNADNINLYYGEIEKRYRDIQLNIDKSTYDGIKTSMVQFAADETKRMKLVHHVDVKGKIYGEALVKPAGLTLEMIKRTAELTEGVLAFVTDDLESDIAKQIKADSTLTGKVLIITEGKVQGREFDTVIIDIEWTTHAASNSMGVLNMITSLYTLTSRSQTGTIIIDKGLSTYAPFNIELSQTDNLFPTGLDAKLLTDFKETRVKVLNRLAEHYGTTTPVADSSVSTGGSTVTETNTSGEAEDEASLFIAHAALLDKEVDDLLASEDDMLLPPEMTNSDITCYPFYVRPARENNNEDLGFLKTIAGVRARKESILIEVVTGIKAHMLYGTGLKGLEDVFPSDTKLDFAKAAIVVRGSRYNEKADASAVTGKIKGHLLQDGDVFLRLALRIPRSGGGPDVYITLAPFATMDRVQKAGADTDVFKQLNNLMKAVENDIKKGITNKAIDFVITDEAYLTRLVPSTNIRLHKLPYKTDANGHKHYDSVSFEEFKESLPNARVSRPYILTKRAPSKISKKFSAARVSFENWMVRSKLGGRPIAFVSMDQSLTNDEDLKNRYAEERFAALSGDPNDAPIPTVRMVILSPEAKEPMQWLQDTMEDLQRYRKEGKRPLVKPSGTSASPEMAAKIYGSIVAIYNQTQGKTGKQKKVNEFCKTIMDRVNEMFGFSGKYDEAAVKQTMAELSKGEFLTADFGNLEVKIATPIVKKGEEKQKVGKVDPEAYSLFYANHAYKLLIALEVAIYGGSFVAKNGGNVKSLNYDSLKAAIPGATESWNELGDLFNTAMKANGFPEGIFTYALYERTAKAGNKTTEVMEFAYPALGDFRVNMVMSMPNVALNLSKVATPEDAAAQIQELIAKANSDIEDEYVALLTTIPVSEQARFTNEYKKKTSVGVKGNTETSIQKSKESILRDLHNMALKAKEDATKDTPDVVMEKELKNRVKDLIPDKVVNTEVTFDKSRNILNFTVETDNDIYTGKVKMNSMGGAPIVTISSTTSKKPILVADTELAQAREVLSSVFPAIIAPFLTPDKAEPLRTASQVLLDLLTNKSGTMSETQIKDGVLTVLNSPNGRKVLQMLHIVSQRDPKTKEMLTQLTDYTKLCK